MPDGVEVEVVQGCQLFDGHFVDTEVIDQGDSLVCPNPLASLPPVGLVPDNFLILGLLALGSLFPSVLVADQSLLDGLATGGRLDQGAGLAMGCI